MAKDKKSAKKSSAASFSEALRALQILGVLEHFDLPRLDPRGADAAHLIAEAGRLAFADRNQYLADADFVPQPLRGLVEDAYLSGRAQLVNRDRAAERPAAVAEPRMRRAG